ncbi:MAG: hypothetical protein HGA96_00530 [Desulfobulbaceae bacterium]|nr:hypothetical protein [Desulfobulbaceae bacterium]
MLVAVALEPDTAEAARILAEWQVAWGAVESYGGVELVVAESLTALLDLKARCYDRGITVNATFPNNQIS